MDVYGNSMNHENGTEQKKSGDCDRTNTNRHTNNVINGHKLIDKILRQRSPLVLKETVGGDDFCLFFALRSWHSCINGG